MPDLSASETNIHAQYRAVPWGDQPATWWQVDYIGPLPSWKGNRHSGYEFAFPVCNVSAKTTEHVLIGYLIHLSWYSLQHCSDQGTHFAAKEVWQWAHAHGVTGLTRFLTILKQLALQNSGMAFRRLR